jgi:hypothetical protein
MNWDVWHDKNKMHMARTRDDSRILAVIFKTGDVDIFEKHLDIDNEEDNTDRIAISFKELEEIYTKAKEYIESQEVKT